MQAYQTLKSHFKKISDFEHTLAILQWDEASMMPVGGNQARAEATAALSAMIHDLKVSPKVGDLLAKVDPTSLSDFDRANIKQMQRAFDKASALPTDFVEKKSLAVSKCEQAWRILRGKNDWQTFRPLLEESFKYAREEADYYAAQSGLDAYGALVDIYEPEMPVQRIEEIFNDLIAFIPDFLQSILSRTPQSSKTLAGNFPIDKQRALALTLMKAVGFDFDHGRLDTSHHPFCGGVPDDVRITTRYVDDSFLSALMGVLHETGHAMYEQGLPKEWRGQPVGTALGMMVHESQSLFWEMQVCRSKSYYKFAGSIIRGAFPGDHNATPSWSDENLWREAIKVKPGLIRIDADEVSYPLHVIMRFELEKSLFGGKLAIKDLPDAWNDKMMQYFGLRTETNYKDGVMQDVHWPAGLFGYFPCYSLGAITAAQLFSGVRRDLPNVDSLIEKGEFSPILSWLRKNVHAKARLNNAETMIKNATGEPLTSKYFIEHLKTRYMS